MEGELSLTVYRNNCKIHGTAIVEPGVELGRNVEIGPYSIIGKNVKIGDGTIIGAHVQIDGWTTIGKNNEVLTGASLGLPPQYSGYEGEKTFLIIGDNNVIREYVTMHRATPDENNETRIGNNNLFMAYSHVAHDCTLGNDIIMANSVNLAGHVTIENCVYLSGLVGVHQFVRIGKMTMV